MEELQKQNEALVARLEKAKEVFKDQKKQIDDKNAKISEQHAEITNLKEQLKNASANEEMQNKLKEAEAKAMDLENKWNDKVIENDDLALELNKTKTALINAKKSVEDFEGKYNSKCSECEMQIGELNKLNTMVAEGKKAYDKLSEDFRNLQGKYQELDAMHNTTKQELEKANKDNAALKQTLAGTDTQITKAKEATNNMKKQMTALISDFNIFA